MSRILITHAGRMGSTAEIAEVVGVELRTRGHAVDVFPCSEAPDPAAFDAVVVGSAIYVRRWEKAATQFLRTHRSALAERPVWLFQSGPCGPDISSMLVVVPRVVHRLATQIGCEDPVTFGGRLDRDRAVTRIGRWMATGPLSGDFRDWDQVERWTWEIDSRLGNAVRDPSARS